MAEVIFKLLLRPGSPITLVFDIKRRYPIPRGLAGSQNTRGWGNCAIFDWNRHLTRKRYEIDTWLLWNVNRKSWVADRSVSAPMTFSGLEMGRKGSNFQADLLNNARTVWHRTSKFGSVTRVGEECISKGSATLYRKLAVPQRSPILGVPFYLCIHP